MAVSGPLMLAADTKILVSPWIPLIYLAILAGWGWVVSSRLDKHAARFFLPRTSWNVFHLLMGLAGLVAAYAFPPIFGVAGWGGFGLGLGTMVALLGLSLLAYQLATSRDERVPAAHKLGFLCLTGGGVAKAVKVDTGEVKGAGKVKFTIKGPDKQIVAAPAAETPEYAVRAAAEDVLDKCIADRGSQIDIQPAGGAQQYQASWLVDGVRSAPVVMAAGDAVKVMDFWKGAAKLDVQDRRRKLTGSVTVERGTDRRVMRVTSQGVQGGMRVSMLLDPEGSVRRKPEDLGMLDGQLALAQEMVTSTNGLVLLAGMADGGRTTLLYTVIGMHDAYTQTVQTVEMEPQLALEGVRHQAFDPTVEGADYSTLVRSMLRRDPDVLGVAEIPDANTAKEIARADFKRSRVYAQLRAGSAQEAVEGWVKAVGEPEMAAKNLQWVVAVRLLRKLCTNCRVPYPASPELLKKLGVNEAKPNQQLFKKGGQVMIKNKPEVCPLCRGVGYIEQSGAFEIVRIGEEERDLIAQGNFPALRAAMKKQAALTVQQSAIRKALEGVTSVEEVMRISTNASAAQAAAAAKA
jgi:type II secretory ATPase GspE/PulE/Tfp pilus assembly ATPase PilB-like protein